MLPAEFRTPGRDSDWGDWRRFYSILLHSGVDGVFADHPDLAVSVRDGH
jgi:glycerophosphoryl diester phosphodiesterase